MKDILFSLCNQNRFNGHNPMGLNVAVHSVYVSAMVWKATKDAKKARAALFHDAWEAYFPDVPAPLKAHPAFDMIRDLEDKGLAVIFEALHLDYPMASEIGEADEAIKVREIEIRDLAVKAKMRSPKFMEFQQCWELFVNQERILRSLILDIDVTSNEPLDDERRAAIHEALNEGSMFASRMLDKYLSVVKPQAMDLFGGASDSNGGLSSILKRLFEGRGQDD